MQKLKRVTVPTTSQWPLGIMISRTQCTVLKISLFLTLTR